MCVISFSSLSRTSVRGNKSDDENLDTRTVSRFFLHTGTVPVLGYRLSSLLLHLYEGAVSRSLERGVQLRGGLVSGGWVWHGWKSGIQSQD